MPLALKLHFATLTRQSSLTEAREIIDNELDCLASLPLSNWSYSHFKMAPTFKQRSRPIPPYPVLVFISIHAHLFMTVLI